MKLKCCTQKLFYALTTITAISGCTGCSEKSHTIIPLSAFLIDSVTGGYIEIEYNTKTNPGLWESSSEDQDIKLSLFSYSFNDSSVKKHGDLLTDGDDWTNLSIAYSFPYLAYTAKRRSIDYIKLYNMRSRINRVLIQEAFADIYSLHHGRYLFYRNSEITDWKTPHDIQHNYNNTNNKIYIYDIILEKNIAVFSKWEFPFYIDKLATFVLLFCHSDSSDYPEYYGSIKRYSIIEDNMNEIVGTYGFGAPYPTVVDDGKLVQFGCTYYNMNALLTGKLVKAIVQGCRTQFKTSTGNWIENRSDEIIIGNLLNDTLTKVISTMLIE